MSLILSLICLISHISHVYWRCTFLFTIDAFLNHFPMKPAFACQLLSKFGRFTWVDSWTIPFKNLIFSPNLEKSLPPPPQHTHSTKFFLPPPKFNLSPPAPPLNSTIDLSLLQYYLLLSSNSFNVQYLQIVVFSFEKTLNDQKHSYSDSRPIPLPPAKLFISPVTVSSPYSYFWFLHFTSYTNAIWKPLEDLHIGRVNLRWN